MIFHADFVEVAWTILTAAGAILHAMALGEELVRRKGGINDPALDLISKERIRTETVRLNAQLFLYYLGLPSLYAPDTAIHDWYYTTLRGWALLVSGSIAIASLVRRYTSMRILAMVEQTRRRDGS